MADVTIGAAAFTLSPLTLGAMRHNDLPPLLELLSTLAESSMPTDQQLDGIMKIVYASIASGDAAPLSLAEFIALVDEVPYMRAVTDILQAFRTVIEISGFQRKTIGGERPGEAAAR